MGKSKYFFNTHLGNPFDFIFVFHRHVMGGILPPSRGIVGKNRSTGNKTTVRSKRVGPLGGQSKYEMSLLPIYSQINLNNLALS